MLLACQNQLRRALSGHVVGIDVGAALEIGAARGYSLAVLSELLPAAEAGLVEALCSDRVRDDGPFSGTSEVRTGYLPPFRRRYVISGSDPKLP